jgi:hypothetical protein
MTDERYNKLNNMLEVDLPTPEEQTEGWHYCYDFDGLLVGPDMAELSCCHCFPANHKVYTTIPKEKQVPIDLS